MAAPVARQGNFPARDRSASDRDLRAHPRFGRTSSECGANGFRVAPGGTLPAIIDPLTFGRVIGSLTKACDRLHSVAESLKYSHAADVHFDCRRVVHGVPDGQAARI
jgi:hypothetical protein